MNLLLFAVQPDIITPLINETVIDEGMNISFTCESVGIPLPTIVWSRTNGALSDRVSVSDNITSLVEDCNVMKVSVNLTIMNASREDTGVYICSASNSIGSDRSDVSVTVRCKFILLTLF